MNQHKLIFQLNQVSTGNSEVYARVWNPEFQTWENQVVTDIATDEDGSIRLILQNNWG